MKKHVLVGLLAFACAIPGAARAQDIPRFTIGKMVDKDKVKFIEVKIDPWVVGSCPATKKPVSYNPGYELWDSDKFNDSHWGFGALRAKAGTKFFGSIAKWPTKGDHVLIGYAKRISGSPTIGGTALDGKWKL
ncbi:MAG: hypothetical protein QGD94_09755, partial [Planctomycetia bacterium]|nr:hypothetical protein [Planctomycetia bacterium]